MSEPRWAQLCLIIGLNLWAGKIKENEALALMEKTLADYRKEHETKEGE